MNPNIIWIEQQYKTGEPFQALNFAKYTKTEKIETCKSLFKEAIGAIAARNLRRHKDNTAIIYWARRIQKDNYDVSKLNNNHYFQTFTHY
jgi:hypothetical protein